MVEEVFVVIGEIGETGTSGTGGDQKKSWPWSKPGDSGEAGPGL